MSCIKLNNITKVYNNQGSKVQALRGVDLVIGEGELVSIMGPSGCGKTTLLNILGTLDTASEGAYLFEDIEVSSFAERQNAEFRNKKIGFVLQNFALLDHYNVRKNIELPLLYGKVKRKDRNQRINELLDDLGLSNQIEQYPTTLSGGQKQRVAIARALALNPKVILSDEPTGALDSENSQNVMDMFKEIHKMGKTIIIVTHDHEIAKQCQRIIHMKDGKIVEEKQ